MTPQQPGDEGRYSRLRPRVVLSDPAGVLVLKSSRGRRFWLIVGSLMLAVAGLFVLASSDGLFMSLAGAVLLGLGAVLFVVQLVRPDALTLRRDEFSFTSLGMRTRFAWADVAGFGVVQVPVRRGTVARVGIRMHVHNSALRRRMTGMSGEYDSALPDSYGLSVAELCTLLEEWRSASAQA
jgi:hypothetical protein